MWQINQVQHQRGVSLIELLLVLAIMAILTFLGINRYMQDRQYAEIATVKENIQLIFTAMDSYYYQYCRVDTPFSPSINDLEKDAGLKLIDTPLVKSYTTSAQIINYTAITKKPIYQFILEVELNVNPERLPYYEGILDAHYELNGELYYTRMPNYKWLSAGNDGWILGSGLGYYKQFMLRATKPNDNSCGF